MPVIPLIRRVVLGATIVFSIIELALGARLISQTQQYLKMTATFCSLCVAVAALSLVTLPVMLVVDIIRRGAFTSMIIVEWVWLSILWILWVAAGGYAASEFGLVLPYGCDFVNSIANGMCEEFQAIQAFAFLNFIILLLYTCLIFVMAVIAANRGTSVWLSSVKESFGSESGGTVEHPMTQYSTSAQGITPAPSSV